MGDELQNAWVLVSRQCRGDGGARGWLLQLKEDVKLGFEIFFFFNSYERWGPKGTLHSLTLYLL